MKNTNFGHHKMKTNCVKIVVALYPFQAIEEGDLTLTKGEEYEVVDDSREHWWQVKNKYGEIGYIPSNYVEEKSTGGLGQHSCE
ncbi:hypothetical protein CDAR_291282 [Caerostris darwini]|uniref:SH3 domain-containing protein n=1 Tax=Caerostris darwini TaxID=1538125 RepID=A0AAV4RML3_9ARAC|nr:hypothetical protein CDAR_291282 [Caerostris darwini]